LLFSFTSLLTPHRTLVNTNKINKCAKFGSILLGVSQEDDENIVIESGQYIRVHLWSQGYVSSAAQVKFEDEMHFLMFCSKYDKTRQDLFSKNMIFWRKIVIFSREIPQKFSRLPLLGAIFLSAPPLT
jgi:hypothetical protein